MYFSDIPSNMSIIGDASRVGVVFKLTIHNAYNAMDLHLGEVESA